MSIPVVSRTAAEIRAALRGKYAAPEWALMFEVGDSTGFAGKGRFADAVAMNLWPSRGMAIHGFEIKVSRADWQKELAHPEKADAVQAYCNHWWIVSPPGIVNNGELPLAWGHYEITADGRFMVRRDAPSLEAVPISRHFIAAMLRRASQADRSEIDAIVRKEAQEIRKDNDALIEREVESRCSKFSDVEKKLLEIKEQTGIDLLSWKPTKDAVRIIKATLASGLASDYSGVSSMRKELDNMSKVLGEFETALFGTVSPSPSARGHTNV